MGSIVRLFLGVLLVLHSSYASKSANVNISDSNNNHEEKSVEISKNILADNLNDNNTSTELLMINKPKTENNTEPIDRRNNLVTDKHDDIKLKPKKIEPLLQDASVILQERENTARRIDVDRYTSKDFQNKVYSLPISSDTEKFVNSDDYDQQNHHVNDFHTFDVDLTTPQTALFDSKYKEAVKTVDQTLDHIDSNNDGTTSVELSSTEQSGEINVEELYNETRKGDGNAQLDYVNYRKIVANDTNNGKNSVRSDVVEEAGTNLDFKSAYNDTKIIDENDEDEEDDVNVPASTPKIITKPTSASNTSHISILNNNIETDPQLSQSKTTKSTATRGSVKFSDYATTTPIALIRSNTPKNKNGTNNEQLVQENQIVPVQVEAPTRTSNETDDEQINTENPSILESTTSIVTESTEEATTEDVGTTTEEASTSTFSTTTITELPEVGTTTVVESTTVKDEETSTIGSTASTNQDYSTDDEVSTVTSSPVETSTVTELPEESNTTEEVVTSTTTDLSATTEESASELGLLRTTPSSTRTSKGFAFETIETTPKHLNDTTTQVISTTLRLQTTEMPATKEMAHMTDASVDYEDSNEEDDHNRTIPNKNVTISVPEIVLVPSTHSPEPIYRDNSNDTTSSDHTNTDSSTNGEAESNTTTDGPSGDDSGTIAAITISAIGAVCLVLLAGLLIVMRKRQKRFNYGQRCRPVNLDDYSMDNVSVYNSVRRKPALRSSKRSYGNPAFDDPASASHPLNLLALKSFALNREDMRAEFEEIPQITAKTTELPDGCDTKNRYANVIPLPETRVFLKSIDNYPNSDYINANYVTGPKNTRGYYIACQAPMQSTVDDFWRMIWEQESKVILMLTHLFENGVEKCVDYLPPSEVLDCHRLFGDFQVTLKKREVKEKYIISILQLKNMVSNSWREITHFWYLGWPEKGVPQEANSLIAYLIEARSYMKSSSLDRKEVTNGGAAMSNGNKSKGEINPVVVHCSPGTGRTGVVIACDIGIREFEQTRLVDVPRIVYKIRRDRAGAVQTKDQYAFIYKVISVYATKLTEVS